MNLNAVLNVGVDALGPDGVLLEDPAEAVALLNALTGTVLSSFSLETPIVDLEKYIWNIPLTLIYDIAINELKSYRNIKELH